MLRVVKLFGLGAALVLLALAAGNSGQFGWAQALTGHSHWVNSVAFSPDGRLLASGSCGRFVSGAGCVEGEIKLWEVASGREVRTLSGHSDWVNSVTFSPDGQLLASGSSDTAVKLWDVATGREVRTLMGGNAIVLVWMSRFTYGDSENRVINFVQLIPQAGKCGILDNVDLVNRTGSSANDFEVVVEGTYSLVKHYTDPRYPASFFKEVANDSRTLFRWIFYRDVPPGNFAHLGLWVWAADCNIRIKSMTWTRNGSVIGKVPAVSVRASPSGQVEVVNSSDESISVSAVQWASVPQPLPLPLLNANDLPAQLQRQGARLQPVPNVPGVVQLQPGQALPLPGVVIIVSGQCPPEPNNNFAQASPISLPFFARCEINPDGENDFFRFRLDGDAEVSIDVDAARIGSGLDAILILWDEAGHDIAYNDDYDGPDPFLKVQLRPGTYFIQVAPHGGHGAGFYELKVEARRH